jgi:apolipoprotein D and lipocalin family protein
MPDTIVELHQLQDLRDTPVPAPARTATGAARSVGRRFLPNTIGVLALGAVLFFTACSTHPPAGSEPVAGFDAQRYAGQWYEVARLDHSFERGLQQTTANYIPNPDGTIKVVNRGFDPGRERWKEAEGKARFTGAPDQGALKVSFFGPFYGGYNVAALDPDYQWSMVVGSNRGYFWILSRTKTLPPGVREQLLAKARALGVEVDKVLWVAQDGPALAAATKG